MMKSKCNSKLLFSLFLVLGLAGCMDAKVANNNANDPDVIIIPGESCESQVIYAGDDNCEAQQ